MLRVAHTCVYRNAVIGQTMFIVYAMHANAWAISKVAVIAFDDGAHAMAMVRNFVL